MDDGLPVVGESLLKLRTQLSNICLLESRSVHGTLQVVDGATVGGHEMGGEPLHDGSAVPRPLLVITAGEENTVTQLA